MAVVRIELPEDRWLEMELATVNDQLAIMDYDPDVKSTREMLDFYLGLMSPRVRAKSWAGDLGDLTGRGLLLVYQHWLAATEDDALPLEPAKSSATPSPKRRSAGQTDAPKASATQASS